MTINFTKGYFFSCALAVIAIILLCMGFVGQYGIHHTVKLENLDISSCNTGEYVEGVITNYAGKYVPTLGNDYFYGESTNFTFGILGGTYAFYTVQVKDHRYITVMLKSKELLDRLKQYSNGYGNDVYITGKIVKLPGELNYPWLASAFETTDRNEINYKVSDLYAVKEADFTKETRKIYEGISLLLISMALFFNCGGLKSLITKQTDLQSTL